MSRDDAQYWDAVGRRWTQQPPDALWRAHSDAVNAALLARWLPVGGGGVGRVLKTDTFDEACGRGLMDVLASRGGAVVGIDISPSTVAAALRRHPSLRATTADVRRLPFGDAAFDLIVSNSTLDHFATYAELASSVAELHRVLRPGGQLLLTLDNPLNPLVGLRNALPYTWLHRAGVLPYQVGVTRGPRALRGLLARAGFEIVETGALLHCPRVVAVALARLLSRRAGSATSRRFLKCLMAFEHLGRLPTRYLTGHFSAVRAVKPVTAAAAAATAPHEVRRSPGRVAAGRMKADVPAC